MDSHVFFFYVEILCKFFRIFKLGIGFFSTFFEQNQKTRKLRTFISFELHMIQFSAKSGTKKFFTSLHFHFTSLSLHLRLTWQVSRVVSTTINFAIVQCSSYLEDPM